MALLPVNEQECQQDALQRMHMWLDVLEERIKTLLQANKPESMKPGEREQAISRHLTLLIRLLQLRQQYVGKAAPDEQAVIDAILQGVEE
ncbi:MAG: hypothetical protein M3Z24_12280 [Chloroflexota bacterium]|nr:hypothetical protein [Chloroflexota bacterium]